MESLAARTRTELGKPFSWSTRPGDVHGFSVSRFIHLRREARESLRGSQVLLSRRYSVNGDDGPHYYYHTTSGESSWGHPGADWAWLTEVAESATGWRRAADAGKPRSGSSSRGWSVRGCCSFPAWFAPGVCRWAPSHLRVYCWPCVFLLRASGIRNMQRL